MEHPPNGGDAERNQPNKLKGSTLLKIMDITNTVTNLCLGGVAFAAIYIARNAFYDLRVHVYLVTFGYILMMSQAVLALSSVGWCKTFSAHQKRTIHWIMQVIGSTLAIAGSLFAIVRFDLPLSSINLTAHGIMGITSMVFTILSLLGGVIHIFSARRQFMSPTISRTLHSLCGTLAILLSFITLVIGFSKVYNVGNTVMFGILAAIGVMGNLSSCVVNIIKRC